MKTSWTRSKPNSQRQRRKPCKTTNNVVWSPVTHSQLNVSRTNSFTWHTTNSFPGHQPPEEGNHCGMRFVCLTKQCYGKTSTLTETNVTKWINEIWAFREFHNIPAVFSLKRSLASSGRLLCLTLTPVAGRPEAQLVYGNGKLKLRRKCPATKSLEIKVWPWINLYLCPKRCIFNLPRYVYYQSS